jgi:hypothetical protein
MAEARPSKTSRRSPCGLQPRVEESSAAPRSSRPTFPASARVGIEQVAKQLAAAAGFAVILDLHALAVVGDNGEEVCPGLGALPGPQRLQQNQSEGGEAEHLSSRGKSIARFLAARRDYVQIRSTSATHNAPRLAKASSDRKMSARRGTSRFKK